MNSINHKPTLFDQFFYIYNFAGPRLKSAGPNCLGFGPRADFNTLRKFRGPLT